MKTGWQDRAMAATEGSRFGAIIASALGRQIPPPCFHGRATVTSDGFVICDFTDSDGNRHMGAFVGSWNDLQTNYVGLSRHLGLTQQEQGEFANTLEAWAGNSRRVFYNWPVA
jgi:hypothetical protein